MKIAIHYVCNAVDAARIALSAPPYNLPMDYATSSHVFLLGPVSQHALEYIDKVQGNVIFHVRSSLDMLTFPAKEGTGLEPIFIDTIFQDMDDLETCIFLLNHSLSVPILSLGRVCEPEVEMEFHEKLQGLEYGYSIIREKN